jgi:hypothetical protein
LGVPVAKLDEFEDAFEVVLRFMGCIGENDCDKEVSRDAVDDAENAPADILRDRASALLASESNLSRTSSFFSLTKRCGGGNTTPGEQLIKVFSI